MEMDKNWNKKIRTIMMMNVIYHSQSNIDRPYTPRMQGGRGLLSIANSVEAEEQNISLYLDKSEERLS